MRLQIGPAPCAWLTRLQHLEEARVFARGHLARRLPNEEAGHLAVRLDYQRHLPGLWEEVMGEPTIISREEDAHPRMGVIPTHQPGLRLQGLDLVVKGDEGLLGEGDEGVSLTGVPAGDGRFDHHKGSLAGLVEDDPAGQPAAPLPLPVAFSVLADPGRGLAPAD